MPREQEVRYICRRLRKEGWVEQWGKGDHLKFKKDGRTIIVPGARKELPLGTYRSIAREAGWL